MDIRLSLRCLESSWRRWLALPASKLSQGFVQMLCRALFQAMSLACSVLFCCVNFPLSTHKFELLPHVSDTFVSERPHVSGTFVPHVTGTWPPALLYPVLRMLAPDDFFTRKFSHFSRMNFLFFACKFCVLASCRRGVLAPFSATPETKRPSSRGSPRLGSRHILTVKELPPLNFFRWLLCCYV